MEEHGRRQEVLRYPSCKEAVRRPKTVHKRRTDIRRRRRASKLTMPNCTCEPRFGGALSFCAEHEQLQCGSMVSSPASPFRIPSVRHGTGSVSYLAGLTIEFNLR